MKQPSVPIYRSQLTYLLLLTLCNSFFTFLPTADRLFRSSYSLSLSAVVLLPLTLFVCFRLSSVRSTAHAFVIRFLLSLLTFSVMTAALLRIFRYFYEIFLFV